MKLIWVQFWKQSSYAQKPVIGMKDLLQDWTLGVFMAGDVNLHEFSTRIAYWKSAYKRKIKGQSMVQKKALDCPFLILDTAAVFWETLQ